MIIKYSKSFLRQTEKLEPKLQAKLYERIKIFEKNPLDPILRNHQLRGKYKEYRSIDIAGDLRALYIRLENEVIFDDVGSHSQLYG